MEPSDITTTRGETERRIERIKAARRETIRGVINHLRGTVDEPLPSSTTAIELLHSSRDVDVIAGLLLVRHYQCWNDTTLRLLKSLVKGNSTAKVRLTAIRTLGIGMNTQNRCEIGMFMQDVYSDATQESALRAAAHAAIRRDHGEIISVFEEDSLVVDQEASIKQDESQSQ